MWEIYQGTYLAEHARWHWACFATDVIYQLRMINHSPTQADYEEAAEVSRIWVEVPETAWLLRDKDHSVKVKDSSVWLDTRNVN